MVEENKETILSKAVTIIGLIFLIGAVWFAIYSTIYNNNVRVNACIDLGYSDIGNSGSMSIYGTCSDINDDLHYVKWTCTGIFFESCTAKNIKQGDVTGVLR